MYEIEKEFRKKVNGAVSDIVRAMARYVATPSLTLCREISEAITKYKAVFSSPVDNDMELSRAMKELEAALDEACAKPASNGAAGKQLAGSFPTQLTYLITQELNRRKISYTIKEPDSFATHLYVPTYSIKEAVTIITEVKKKHRRIRI